MASESGSSTTAKSSKPDATQSLERILPRSARRPSSESDVKDEKSKDNIESAPPSQLRRQITSDWRTGTWRGKATAVASLSHDYLAAAAETTAGAIQAHVPEPVAQVAGPVLRTLRTRKSSASLASTTRLSVDYRGEVDPSKQEVNRKSVRKKEYGMAEQPRTLFEGSKLQERRVSAEGGPQNVDHNTGDRPLPSAAWGGWWSRPTNAVTAIETANPADKDLNGKNEMKIPEVARENGPKESLDTALPTGPKQSATDELMTTEPAPTPANTTVSTSRNSWFGLWGGSAVPPSKDSSPTTKEEPLLLVSVPSGDHAQAGPSGQPSAISSVTPNSKKTVPPVASSSWGLWSRPLQESSATTTASNSQQSGGTGSVEHKAASSETKPSVSISTQQTLDHKDKADQFLERKSRPVGRTVPIADLTPLSTVKSAEATDKQASAQGVQMPTTSSAGGNSSSDSKSSTAHAASTTKIDCASSNTTKLPEPSTNLVLPTVRDTLKMADSLPYYRNVMHKVWRSTEPPSPCLAISSNLPRIKRALVVGIHGLFPAPLLQKVLGPPKGTSIRFANGAVTALEKWLSQHGQQCEIDKVALEGEGLILDRVEALWKLLLNWLPNIRKADMIVMACHSQGVPVAVMLMAKLIQDGCLKSSARLSICGMAAVNLGPIPTSISRLPVFGEAASELHMLSQPSSTVHTTHISALRTCVAHHVRISYTASLDDQLVSLESAVFATVSHPYIFRAIYVDGRVHAPNFLVKLVELALKLRNLGISDHGLIRELSIPVAGSLYSSDGHSRVYEEDAVYDCAIEFAMETTTLQGKDLGELLVVKEGYEAPGAAGTSNPYVLPWALRGALEERVARDGPLKADADKLLQLFEEWKPTTKVLKDVRYRLEAVSKIS